MQTGTEIISEKSIAVKPRIIRGLLKPDLFALMQQYVRMVRKGFEGTPYPDKRFMRHFKKNDPFLVGIHQDLVRQASDLVGKKVKKSYVYLSLYGDQGICPRHTDRPQCKYTLDLSIAHNKPWEIYVDDQPYLLEDNDALLYSGTDSPHYRNRIPAGGFYDLVFFHFVDDDFQGSLDVGPILPEILKWFVAKLTE